MSLTLDDLGRAVFESTPEELRPVKKTWEELDDESHRVANIFALAAVERFAEEVCKKECWNCSCGDPVIRGVVRWFHPGKRQCQASSVRNILSSLREEVKP